MAHSDSRRRRVVAGPHGLSPKMMLDGAELQAQLASCMFKLCIVAWNLIWPSISGSLSVALCSRTSRRVSASSYPDYMLLAIVYSLLCPEQSFLDI